MIVLIGASACGKTTVANELCKNFGYEKIVTYTTRPIREGEVDGIDYHFIDETRFDDLSRRKEFLETATYNNWHYASNIPQGDLDNKVIILTPKGYRNLCKSPFIDHNKVLSIYLDVDRKSRMIKLLERGDNIEEVYRRNVSDVGMFDGIEDEVNLHIDNSHYKSNAEFISRYIHETYENMRYILESEETV